MTVDPEVGGTRQLNDSSLDENLQFVIVMTNKEDCVPAL